MIRIITAGLLLASITLKAQTAEDSLQSNQAKERQTYLSGYGEAFVGYDARYKTATANFTRAVVFIGHKFNNSISFLSETELENARVEGGEEGGELSLEQAYLRFQFNRNMYIQAGLFIPRIGIINENHLPTTYHGNQRPFTETYLIPSTWRELGISLYGTSERIQGLNYSIALVNGLNASGFVNGTGLRGGRFEGSNATASNLALTGSVQYYTGSFIIQASGYYGGTAGLSKRQADSLQLDSGPFGTPVALTEVNARYQKNRLSARILAAAVFIPDADKINRAYANNTASSYLGGYAEVSYRIFNACKTEAFVRYENLNLNASVPSNGLTNGLLEKQFVIAGLSCYPVAGVVIKLDYTYRKTGDLNPALNLNPFPNAPAYYTTNSFINLGIGYSF
jgi:hypothetical protein